MTAVCQTIECRARQPFTAEYFRPVFEWKVCGDDQTLALVRSADHVEEQFRADLAGWHVTKFIQDEQVQF